MTAAYPKLDNYSVALLRAITDNGAKSIEAYWAWRESTILSEADARSYTALPLLLEMVQREGIEDPDLPRMKGVTRQIWAANVLKLRALFAALETLNEGGIDPILIKAAALFARSPNLLGRRAAGDYDMLIPAGRLADAVELLDRRGFSPASLHWDDFNDDLYSSVSAGMPVSHPDYSGEIDIHWRPLWNNHAPEIGADMFRASETLILQGRQVKAIAAADHVFIAVARCEPWDHVECFARLLEVHLLLSAHPPQMDWSRLTAQLSRFGYRAVALWFFRALEDATGTVAPASFLADLEADVSGEEEADLAIRSRAPWVRTESDDAAVSRTDFRLQRMPPAAPPPPDDDEVRLREIDPQHSMQAIWERVAKRVSAAPLERFGYIEGFSSPEELGRWTSGRWSILSVPLNSDASAAQRIYLEGTVLSAGSRRWVFACAGKGIFKRVLVRGETQVSISLDAKPVEHLGRVALLLLYFPSAAPPAVVSVSGDKRVLGIFLPKAQSTRDQRTFVDRLRQVYRAAPLSREMRERVSPALIGTLAWTLGWLPSRRAPPSSIAPGDIVVAGYFSDVSGIARAGRLTAEALQSWSAEITRHDLGRDPAAQAVRASDERGLWICHCNPPEALALMLGTTNRYWRNRYRICYLAYELPRLPGSWHSTLRHFHEVWAPSEFVARAVRAAAPSDLIVRVVPHPVSIPESSPTRGPAREGTFRFLSMLDMRSTAARKNPLGAILAYQRAFLPGTKHVHLGVKVVESETDSAGYSALKDMIADWPNISLVTDRLTDGETLDLIRKCDCLVSLHRSEGFGLTIAEAMTVGTPAIVTGWSAPTEFCAGASILVGYSLVPVADRSGRYRGQKWAEPNLEEAAQAMRRLSADKSMWQSLSDAGPALARERFSRFPSKREYRQYVQLSD